MKIENKLLKNILMILFYFIYQIIPLLIMTILGIKINTNNEKIIYSFIVNLSYLLFVIFIYRKEIINDFKNIKIRIILRYIPIYLLGILLMAITNILATKITGKTISGNEELVRNYIKLFPIYMCFSTIVFAPIVEEIIFRKAIRNIIKNNIFYILIAGFIFGFIHMSLDGNMINNFIMTIPYIVMGIDLAYIYYKSNNIFTTITIHSMHNLILMIIQLIGGNL